MCNKETKKEIIFTLSEHIYEKIWRVIIFFVLFSFNIGTYLLGHVFTREKIKVKIEKKKKQRP